MFLFIAISYMAFVSNQRAQVRKVAIAWEEGRGKLYHALEHEFRDDLPAWNAELDSVKLSVRFKEPDVLFEAGQSIVRPRFKEILDESSFGYARIVHTYGGAVEEVGSRGIPPAKARSPIHITTTWRCHRIEPGQCSCTASSRQH